MKRHPSQIAKPQKQDLQFLLFNWYLIIIAILSSLIMVVNLINQRPLVNILTSIIIFSLCVIGYIYSKYLGRYNFVRIGFMIFITFIYVPFGYITSPGSESAMIYLIIMTILLLSFMSVNSWEYIFPVIVSIETLILLQSELWFPNYYYQYTDKSYRVFDLSLNFLVVAFTVIVIAFYIMSRYASFSSEFLRASVTDSLTGLYNRRYFSDFLTQQLEKANTEKGVFSLILLDLDYFKSINDEYGHLVGDQILIGISSILKKYELSQNKVCRWGGEEFIIFLIDVNLEDAAKIAEEIRIEIREMNIESAPTVTCSFGVTEVTYGDDTLSIFKRIDNSLYLAKLTGRDKVVSNEEIFLYKGGLPTSIEWGPFFRSGQIEIDKEHNELILLSNELIANCFLDNNQDKILSLFENIISHIALHFSNEEKILKLYQYVEFDEHCMIHKDLLLRTQSMFHKVKIRKEDPTALAKYIIQEVIVGHIIRQDFKFFDLFRI